MSIGDTIGAAIAAGNAGDWNRAHDLYERAYEMDPKNTEVTNGLGIACYRQREFGQARDCYAAACALDPENPQALAGLAMSHQALGVREFETAGRYVLKLRAIDPRSTLPPARLEQPAQTPGNPGDPETAAAADSAGTFVDRTARRGHAERLLK